MSQHCILQKGIILSDVSHKVPFVESGHSSEIPNHNEGGGGGGSIGVREKEWKEIYLDLVGD